MEDIKRWDYYEASNNLIVKDITGDDETTMLLAPGSGTTELEKFGFGMPVTVIGMSYQVATVASEDRILALELYQGPSSTPEYTLNIGTEITEGQAVASGFAPFDVEASGYCYVKAVTDGTGAATGKMTVIAQSRAVQDL